MPDYSSDRIDLALLCNLIRNVEAKMEAGTATRDDLEGMIKAKDLKARKISRLVRANEMK